MSNDMKARLVAEILEMRQKIEGLYGRYGKLIPNCLAEITPNGAWIDITARVEKCWLMQIEMQEEILKSLTPHPQVPRPSAGRR